MKKRPKGRPANGADRGRSPAAETGVPQIQAASWDVVFVLEESGQDRGEGRGSP